MALTFQKITSSNTAKNVFVTFIKSSVSQPLYPKPKPPTTFNTYFMENYSVIEIQPPPYCSICNKYMTNSYCNSVIKPNECPYN